jgi:putative chitinase
MVSTEQILLISRVKAEKAKQFAPHIDAAFLRFKIETREQRAGFLAQAMHESQDLNRLVENLHYTTVEQLRRVWPTRFATLADAALVVRNPERLANTVYSNRLGNGDFASGDGWRYRGRGIFQLTGRANYMAAGEALNRPYKYQPDLVAEVPDAVLTAAWYWAVTGCNECLKFDATTRKINPAMHGAKERRGIYERILELTQ